MNKREHLIEISYGYFMRHGYMNSTIKDILTEAGVSRGGFYHHFESKDDLLIEVFERYHRERIDESLAFLTECRTYRQYIEHLTGLLKTLSTPGPESETMLYSVSFILEAIREVPKVSRYMVSIFDEILAQYSEFIGKCQSAGELRLDIDAAETAKFLISFVEGHFIMSIYFSNGWSCDYVSTALENHYSAIKV